MYKIMETSDVENVICWEISSEREVIAIFYNYIFAVAYVNMLNGNH